MRTIELNIKKGGGIFALVDDEDYENLSKLVWYLDAQNYASTSKTVNGKRIITTMHRMIMNPNNAQVDHINHNKIDNRKINLRLCTALENSMNRRPYGKSGYKGVYYQAGMWRTQIRLGKTRIYLGIYKDIKDAARAYNKAAEEYFGEYAWLNDL